MNRIEHITAVLAEEGGEVAKECSKALRFGHGDKVTRDPFGPRGTEGPTNAEKITAEFVDMLGVYQMLVTEGIVEDLGLGTLPAAVLEGMAKKAQRVEDYMLYAAHVGAMNAIPDLKEFPCFQGMDSKPWRLLAEGPGGKQLFTGAGSFDGIVESLTRSGMETGETYFDMADVLDGEAHPKPPAEADR